MMDTQHTPGPWECYPCLDRAGERITSLDICSPHEPAEPGAAVIASVWGNEANAHLIAAAPELYEATDDARQFAAMFLAFVGRDQGTSRLQMTLGGLSKMAVALDAKARSALAKAHGAASADRSGAAGETALAGSTEGESAVGAEGAETPKSEPNDHQENRGCNG